MFSTPTRTITALDPDASKVVPLTIDSGQTNLTLGLISSLAGATITLRIYWVAKGGYVGQSLPITFTAGSVADWGSCFTGITPSPTTFQILGDMAMIKVDAMVPATAKWTLCAGTR